MKKEKSFIETFKEVKTQRGITGAIIALILSVITFLVLMTIITLATIMLPAGLLWYLVNESISYFGMSALPYPPFAYGLLALLILTMMIKSAKTE